MCCQACGRCHAGGDLICCDGCDAVYHAECVGISVVPEGDWFCPTCVSAKKNEVQRTAGPSAVLPGAAPGRPAAKAAVAGTNDEVPANAAKSKRPRPTSAVETAATAAVAASSKKPRTVVGDKGGGAGSGSKAEQAPARGGGGRQPRPSSKMERVPIKLGSARSAASGVAGVPKQGSSEASSPAPAESAATKSSASSASHRNEKDRRASSDQLGKRPQGPQTAEQNPGKRAAREGKIAALPAKNTAKAAAPEPPARSALGGSATAVGGGAQKTAIPVRSELPENKPGGEWDCLCCTHRNHAEDKRCRQCEGLRLVGAEVTQKVPRTIAPVPPTAAASAAAVATATAAAVPVAAPASLVGTSNLAPRPMPARRFEIEPIFSRPASAVANAAAAAALAAAAAGARAAGSPRSRIEPIFSRPASAVANAAAAAAAAAAGAASARAARAPAPPAPAPSRVWCCRACSTFNRRSTIYCVSCRTRKEFKDVEEGKPDWWCCRKCSRFNNRSQDGNTCRVCAAVDQDDPVEQEEEEEIISVGEDISMPGMAATAAERFVQL